MPIRRGYVVWTHARACARGRADSRRHYAQNLGSRELAHVQFLRTSPEGQIRTLSESFRRLGYRRFTRPAGVNGPGDSSGSVPWLRGRHYGFMSEVCHRPQRPETPGSFLATRLCPILPAYEKRTWRDREGHPG